MENNSFEYGVQNIKYDGQRTTIPKEINNVKDRLVGNFSLKECGFIAVAVLLFYLGLKFCSAIPALKGGSMVFASVLAIIPIFMGFFKISGFPLPEYLLFLKTNLWYTSPARRLNVKNEYERLESQYYRKKKLREKRNGKKMKLKFMKMRGK